MKSQSREISKKGKGMQSKNYVFLCGKNGITCYNGEERVGFLPSNEIQISNKVLHAIKTQDFETAGCSIMSYVCKQKQKYNTKTSAHKVTLQLPKGFTISHKKKTVSYNKKIWPDMYELLSSMPNNRNWNRYFPKFLLRLQKLQKRDREMLISFLNKNRDLLAFDKRGNLLLWKRVAADLSSYHKDADGSTVRNEIGKFTTMPREKVERNPDVACAAGLHVCSLEYLKNNFQDNIESKLILCCVDPKDIVSIPRDAGQTKLRVCRYKPILAIKSGEFASAINRNMQIQSMGQDITNKFSELGQKSELSVSAMGKILGLGKKQALQAMIALSKVAGMKLKVPQNWDGEDTAGVKLIREI